MTKRCKGCQYYASYTDTCDFFLLTYQRRGCPPEQCTRYEPLGQDTVRSPLQARALIRKQLVQREQMQKLYDQGLTDPDIARQIGVSGSTVCHWRHANGLPPHAHFGGNRK